ncbi:ferric uptake regulator, Fur family [Dethiosulfovibrio peptidovorans DSM 11002]|uniref:Ferric uptake regulator, Fur family n=1 Tax=Dethiosulfovibrio peptidovorans DSM 11002 TaxID=469381 RepID=D2Z539_9BACT|nr:transcriptional repressor [Dethiosulfovibrio peptidovorans]EFC90598.1 ferric uptake regulator, Fur family [Dethiosulfovibrio peptidovorans DSM 11002]
MAMQRRSRQRDAILKVFEVKGAHPTAEEVLSEVRKEIPNVSLGTVYRNLDQLCEAGMIWKIQMEEGPCRYEGNPDGHLHAVCPICGEIRDVWPSGDPIARDSLPEEFAEAEYRLLLISPCERCRPNA